MYCTKCGAENKDAGNFCRKCGAPLRKSEAATSVNSTRARPVSGTPRPADATPPTEVTTGLQPHIAGFLCYILGWISGVVFLFIEGKDKFVRFHAWQSIVTFGILTALLVILSILSLVGGLLSISLMIIYWLVFVLSIVLWIFLMLKAYQGHIYKLPVAGDIAKKLMDRG